MISGTHEDAPAASRAATRARTRPDVSATVRRLWERFRTASLERVAALDEAVEALRQDSLDDRCRARAVHEAHKLAGSVGTFGFQEGTRLAREIERRFADNASLAAAVAPELATLVGALRRELDRETPPPSPDSSMGPAPTSTAPLLLVVDDDPELGERLVLEAATWGLRARLATSLDTARATVSSERPDVVLLDLTFPAGRQESLEFLKLLRAQQPNLPVLVFTGSEDFADRVAVARLGARGFIQKPTPPAQVLDVVAQAVQPGRPVEGRVLVVDDDAHVLETIRELFAERQIEVLLVDDPRRFWDVLEESAPDLVVLDIEMPHLSGLELCRVVRTDPRWTALPIICLTAHADADTRHRMYGAGADDYVTKPFSSPELITRVMNRLERARLQRALVETDALTGLANRRKAGQMLSRYLRLADRHQQALSLAIIDLDHFKQINDRHGHAAGDTVLRQVGQLLQTLRGEDVVARWGGEEFLVGMYGTTKAQAVHRLAELLERLRGETFSGEEDSLFQVTFSAGVAEYPRDGTDLQSLYTAADAALYRAKAAGRDRVLPVAESSDDAVPDTDVAILSKDAPAAHRLLRALETRGYQATWLSDEGAIQTALSDEAALSSRAYVVDAEEFRGALGTLAQRRATARHGTAATVFAIAARTDDVVGASIAGQVEYLDAPLDAEQTLLSLRRALDAPRGQQRLPA